MHPLGCFPSEELIAIMTNFGIYAARNRDSYHTKPMGVRAINFKYKCYIKNYGWENPCLFCDCCKEIFVGYGLVAEALDSLLPFSYDVCELCWAETVGQIILTTGK